MCTSDLHAKSNLSLCFLPTTGQKAGNDFGYIYVPLRANAAYTA